MNHLENRDKIIDFLRAEVCGPDLEGTVISEINPESKPHESGPYIFKSPETGQLEEVLRNEPPNLRYGVGVLYPKESKLDDEGEDVTELLTADPEESPELITTDPENQRTFERGAAGTEAKGDDGGIRLDHANVFQPSSMGVSFLASLRKGESLVVTGSYGRYDKRPKVRVCATKPDGRVTTWDETWWIRQSAKFTCRFDPHELLTKGRVQGELNVENGGSTEIKIEAFVRSAPEAQEEERLVTIILENTSPKADFYFDHCIYQVNFRAEFLSSEGALYRICPYPKPPGTKLDPEAQSLEVLYRNFETYAVGHGCSATWDVQPQQRKCSFAAADPMPVYMAPSIAFDVETSNGEALKISMPDLAVMEIGDATYDRLEAMLSAYQDWIDVTEASAMSEGLDQTFIAEQIGACRNCADRIADGLRLLRKDEAVLRAFRLANEAMQWQGVRSALPLRPAALAGRGNDAHWQFDAAPAEAWEPKDVRVWRPFQIAFLLMSLRSVIGMEPEDGGRDDRETVDLIWFPTGGGKTEAYLGLTAFLLFYYRLMGRNVGTQVIMRYTLRLLTQQQVERAASLMCAMEFLRGKYGLGGGRFSVGIWAGSDFIPNTRADAVKKHGELVEEGKISKGNLLILTKCPWCGAEIGARKQGSRYVVLGASRYHKSVRYVCPDSQCRFRAPSGVGNSGGSGLPVMFIDEEMYESPPTLLIGTVDKFATMHLQPKARVFFGLRSIEGVVSRESEPPQLIVQDELHLIAGPLGSLMGLYEGLIEQLCVTKGGAKPKIVCSTATTRAYRKQVRSLFARPLTRLFPSPGTDASDSFFAKYARSESGELRPGKKYVGLLTSYSSSQMARTRVIMALAQGPVRLSDQIASSLGDTSLRDCARDSQQRSCKHGDNCLRRWQDPWWTNLIFFNSLRELGNAITLFQSDIPDWRVTIERRYGEDRFAARANVRLEELTSRLRHDEVPKSLAGLAVTRMDEEKVATGACLASTIIEVGIDVNRLSLLTVMAQPKTSSTYIQVTGRVGRSWRYDTQQGAPGLVVVLFAPERPRDRSHYEQFRSYHERLYAHVEPASLTPFASPVLERALHGVYCAYIRLVADPAKPAPYPSGIVPEFMKFIQERVTDCAFAEEERGAILHTARQKLERWKGAPPAEWSRFHGAQDDCLLRGPSGDPSELPSHNTPWATPSSMRNVDAEVSIKFSQDYTPAMAGIGPEGEDEWEGL